MFLGCNCSHPSKRFVLLKRATYKRFRANTSSTSQGEPRRRAPSVLKLRTNISIVVQRASIRLARRRIASFRGYFKAKSPSKSILVYGVHQRWRRVQETRLEATFVFDNQRPPHPSWSKGQHFSVRDTRDQSLQRMHYSWGWRGKCCPKFNSVAHEGGSVRDLPSAGFRIFVLVSLSYAWSPLPFLFLSLLIILLALVFLSPPFFLFLLLFLHLLRCYSTNRPAISEMKLLSSIVHTKLSRDSCFLSIFFLSSSPSILFHLVFSLPVLIGSLAADQNSRGQKLLNIGSDDCYIKCATWNDFRDLNRIGCLRNLGCRSRFLWFCSNVYSF